MFINKFEKRFKMMLQLLIEVLIICSEIAHKFFVHFFPYAVVVTRRRRISDKNLFQDEGIT